MINEIKHYELITETINKDHPKFKDLKVPGRKSE